MHRKNDNKRINALLPITIFCFLCFKRYNIEMSNVYIHFRQRNFTVFDCFMYNGESQMLYIHLWRLYPYVDHFIMSISKQTHSGKPNKVTFDPFKEEIKQFMDKITIIEVDLLKALKSKDGSLSWAYENFQRDELRKGIDMHSPETGDLIFIEDVDEIITRKGIQEILLNPPQLHYNLMGLTTPNNYLQYYEYWPYAVVVRYFKELPDFSIIRNSFVYREYPDYYVVTHCSYCFNNIEQYIRKFKSFAHVEFDRFPYTDPSFIFRVNYCRRHPPLYRRPTTPVEWGDELLVPPDRRLWYLVDPHFMLDIRKTNYSEGDLPTLCEGINDYNPNGDQEV